MTLLSQKMKTRNLRALPTRLLMRAITALIAFYLGLCGNTAKANPVIGNIFPDGTYQFQNTNQLAFAVTSSANITNITLSLSYTPLGGNGTILKIYGVG